MERVQSGLLAFPSPHSKYQQRYNIHGESAQSTARCLHTLVLSTSGGLGREATTFYKFWQISSALKSRSINSNVISWLRYGSQLSFSILQPAIMFIRGSPSSHHRKINVPLTSSNGIQHNGNCNLNPVLSLSLFGMPFIPGPFFFFQSPTD